MKKEKTKKKEIKIRVIVKPDFFWTEDFELEGLTFDKIDSVRKEAIDNLINGFKETDNIRFVIKTEVIIE